MKAPPKSPQSPVKRAKRLPKARVMWAYPAQYKDGSAYDCGSKHYASQDLCVAVIPCATPAEARAVLASVYSAPAGKGQNTK